MRDSSRSAQARLGGVGDGEGKVAKRVCHSARSEAGGVYRRSHAARQPRRVVQARGVVSGDAVRGRGCRLLGMRAIFLATRGEAREARDRDREGLAGRPTERRGGGGIRRGGGGLCHASVRGSGRGATRDGLGDDKKPKPFRFAARLSPSRGERRVRYARRCTATWRVAWWSSRTSIPRAPRRWRPCPRSTSATKRTTKRGRGKKNRPPERARLDPKIDHPTARRTRDRCASRSTCP